MAVFTELSFDEVTAFFRALGLATPRSLRGITGGIENTNYFVDTDGEAYVLTLFERLTFGQLPFYLHLMKHLAARGLPMPDPVADAHGVILHSLRERPAVSSTVFLVRARQNLRPPIAVPSGSAWRACTWPGAIIHDNKTIRGGFNGGTRSCRCSAATYSPDNARYSRLN